MTCNGVQGSGVRLLGVRGVPLGGSRQVAGSSCCAGGPTLAAVGFPAPCRRVAGVAPGVLRVLMAWHDICAVLRVAWLDILRGVPPGVGDMTRGSACTSCGGLPTPLAKPCEPSTIQTPLANQQLHSSPTHQQWPRQQVRVTQARVRSTPGKCVSVKPPGGARSLQQRHSSAPTLALLLTVRS